MKQKLRSGDEYDVVCSRGHWRRHYCYLQRPGATNEIKTRLRRRARHEASREIREGRFD